MFFFALIHSNILHLIEVYGTAGQGILMRLERLQRRALKAIFGHRMRHGTIELYQEAARYGILPVKAQYYKSVVLMAVKIDRGIVQSNLRLTRNIMNRTTRVSETFVVPRTYSATGDKKFSVVVSQLGNMFPHFFELSTTIPAMKRQLFECMAEDPLLWSRVIDANKWPLGNA